MPNVTFQTLDQTIRGIPFGPNNDVTVPVGDPLIFRDGGNDFTPLQIVKTVPGGSGTNLPGIEVVIDNLAETGVSIRNAAATSGLELEPGGVFGRDGNNGSQVTVKAGSSTGSGQAGGTLVLEGGDPGAGGPAGFIQMNGRLEQSSMTVADNSIGGRTFGANALFMAAFGSNDGNVTSGGIGSALFAYVDQGASSLARVASLGQMSFVIGSATSANAGTAEVVSDSGGSITVGHTSQTAAGTATVETTASSGGNTRGVAVSGGVIRTNNSPGGSSTGAVSSGGTITATFGTGANASGFADGASSAIQGFGSASLSRGLARSGNAISAFGNAAFAMGNATGSFGITASGIASFAFGNADTAAITASAQNAVQFGPGSNAQTDSLQVGGLGSGIRLLGTGALPSVNANGGIRNNGGVVTIRSANVDVNFSNPSVTGSRGGNVALASLLTQLAAMNLIRDNTTA